MKLFSRELADRLRKMGDDLAESYATADPFPHIMIDDFLPAEPLEAALGEFPAPRGLDWKKMDTDGERKLMFEDATRMSPALRDVLFYLNSSDMLDFLQRLTRIEGIIPDPYFYGGGMHQIERGGFLEVHADFNKYDKLKLDRRLNLLLYMNKDWSEDFGGHLELWNRTMTRCARRVLPVFNRCVVFSTTDFAFHGHPIPLTCPPERSRKSFATYYYSNGRPEEEASPKHSTLFQVRPEEKTAHMAKKVIRSLLPPVVFDSMKYVKTKVLGS